MALTENVKAELWKSYQIVVVESEADEQIVDNKEQGGIRLHSVRPIRRCIQGPDYHSALDKSNTISCKLPIWHPERKSLNIDIVG